MVQTRSSTPKKGGAKLEELPPTKRKERKKTQEKKSEERHDYEFGGPVGALGIMAGLPAVMYVSEYHGTPSLVPYHATLRHTTPHHAAQHDTTPCRATLHHHLSLGISSSSRAPASRREERTTASQGRSRSRSF